MKTLRHAACILMAAAFFFASPAYTTSFSTDQSDLWWIPTESGWGMQLVQRGEIIFATIFVYGPTGAPTWYTATLNPTAISLRWTGTLYATTGPWFGTVPFDPASVTLTPVGTMTWNGIYTYLGTVSYTVNGVQVTKNVVRQFIANDNYSGIYYGALLGTAAACTNAAADGPFDAFATTTVVQNGQSINVTIVTAVPAGSVSITYTLIGTLTQQGQFGDVVGSYTTSAGESGGFELAEMGVQDNHWTALFSFSGTNDGCIKTGSVGGMRNPE
jgi:hypothetical protein